MWCKNNSKIIKPDTSPPFKAFQGTKPAMGFRTTSYAHVIVEARKAYLKPNPRTEKESEGQSAVLLNKE